MKKIILSIFITLILITGCSKENETQDYKQPINEQSELNTNETLNTSNTVVEQVMENALKDSLKNSEDGVVVIKDKLFIAQCNDIYLNPDEYMDKTIKWEGIYTEATNPDTKELYKFVIRYGPGCCGNDGTAGFEILYDKETPKQNDWVEATGKIEMIEENGKEFVAIRLSELKVLDVRGQEVVEN